MKTNVYPQGIRKNVFSILLGFTFWLVPFLAKADTPIPTGIVTSYNSATQKLTINVNWYWTSQASNKFYGVAVFADLNGDGIVPTIFSNPATYTSGGNPFPAGLQARDEFLGQLAISPINGSATSTRFPAIIDNTDNGVSSGVSGVTTTTPVMLFPYGTNSAAIVNNSGSDNGNFVLTYNNVTVSPTQICVILYDAHTAFTSSGRHSVITAGSVRNTDNSLEEGNVAGTVSCTGLVNLNCAINKTEASCQTQAAINASYAAWLATVTATGCSGVLTNNSTGAPPATGGSKTVTFTYTQNQCSNQPSVTTCSATFTVNTCTTGSIGDRVWYDTDVDGIQDAGENGIMGVTVKLRNSSNVVVATDVTDASGNYSFTGLNTGSYTVEFPTSVFGYELSPAYVGANRAIDSDPSVSSGLTPVINLGVGENNSSIDAGYAPDCDCVNSPNNLLVNASFESGTTGWSWSSANGSLTTGTGYVACGSKNGFNNQSSGTSKVWQDVPVIAGSSVVFSAFAGVHTAGLSCSPKLSLIYLNASNTVLGQSDVTVTRDVDINNSQLEKYTLTGIAPAGTTKVRVQSSITCNTMKLDAFCLTVTPPAAVPNPDFNSTYVNVPVPGDVSTNDKVPAGTTYGTTPTLVSSPAGSTATITMNSNGTYSFVANKPGVYTYNVPVCSPGQAAPCPPTALVITVLDSNINTNPPVANVDIATTNINTPVTLKSLANDAAGNANNKLVPSSVTVTIAPLRGTATVNPANGDITYTPNAGYVGKDTLTYQVCDDQSPAKCATAQQIITIKPSTSDNTTAAADDYNIVPINTAGTGNVKINDTDPEGNTQTVTAQPGTTIAGKGTLVLQANGDYTFTPVTGFSGPVDFPYTTCDNGVPQACASATLHILVRPEVPVTNPDFNSTYVNVPVPGNVSTNDKMPVGTTYGTSPTLTSSPAGSTATITMNSNGTYSFVADKPGVYTYNVPVCLPAQAAPCPPTALVITVLDSYTDKNAPVANVDIATTKINTPVTLKSLANDAAGNATTALVPGSVTITVDPDHGTAVVNPVTGDITYTPDAGYAGYDTLTYQVCDNQTPAKCATAKQIITIRPNASPNTTAAADDYNIVPINTAGTGNVKINDTDPEGNTQTVTAQPGTTIAGKGTLVLQTNGDYSFTPVTGFSGPVDFPYTTCDNGTPSACATATLHILVRPEVPVTNPDFNSTYVNVPVPGDVSTNDKMPAGTTYGTSPTLVSSPAGSTATITMNSNGTYSFVADKPGVYTYNVPVCLPAQAAPCPPTALVITVLDSYTDKNAPVANVDIATTKINTPVTLKSLANDAAGNATTALVPASVTVTAAPAHGTAVVNLANGDITYTPAAGYVGTDTLTYQVCDNQTPAKCATAKQIITIRPNASPNTTAAADDYIIVPINTAGTGNVKTNDTDPEGNAQVVTAQTTTVPGKGTLVLVATGDYTFTPVTGFSGPVDFPYTTCDNGTPSACATATLHILVRPEVPVTNPDFNSTYVNVPVPGNVSTNDKMPAGTTYGTPSLLSNPAGSTATITMNSNGTYNFVADKPGVYTYNVPVCLPAQAAPCPPTALVITVLDANTDKNAPVANVDIATTKINTPVTLKSLANDAAGNAITALVPASVTVTAAPAHGTAVVNPANGDITYTPAAGYVGYDTLTYQVCDNQIPAKCATAKQIITIRPTVSSNTTAAADDYKIGEINTPATGNVKTNDTDPEGNAQTVTAQPGTIVPGKGTLVLAADGSYTFTPVTGYTGPVDFPYTTCDNGTPSACATATLHILVRPEVPVTNPDFNSTYVNVPVPGNVSTNDKMPAGTTYGTTPTLVSSPAGSTPVLTMNSNGTYSFVTDKPGVYTYNVPVCLPAQVAPCPPTPLVITVLDANIGTNPPVANVDIATTKMGVPVTLKSLANDAAGNLTTALVPGSVTVTVAPAHGTATVNLANGDITYTPAAGYVGTDTLTYQVCDNQTPAKCATAKQIITIRPTVSPNTTAAADDYKITEINTPATGNVKTNDTDPEGNTQTVTAQPGTVVAGKGTLVLAADGSYTFTPVTGYSGPVDFPYTTCDNGVPQACASATLHILVRPEVPVTNPDFNSTYVNVPVPGNVSTNDKMPAGTTYGTTPTLVSSPAGSTPVLTMNSNGTYTFVTNTPGVYTYNVPVCLPAQVAPCPPTPLVITVLDGSVFTNPPVANVDIATTLINTPVTLKSLVNDAAGNVTTALVPASVTVTVAPAHGTTSVNPANGDITYTPAAGYVGTDTLTYQVCDNQAPAKCATAKQIITIRPAVSANTTAAADDYKITAINTPASGNVKTNDTDPEGNTQTVTAQPGTIVAGKGTLVLAADGSYTFTPVAGYSGPVDFPYTTCDNGIPQACASATLHILVRPSDAYTNPDFNSTYVNVPVPGNVRTNDNVPAGTTYGTSPTLVSGPAGSTPVLTMNSNGTYTFVTNTPGVYTYNVPVCQPGQVAPCPPTPLVITVLNSNINTNPPVANVDIATTFINTPVTLKTLANDAAGNITTALVPSSVAVTVAPLHGTTSVNPANGDITYTPAAGYVGSDTLTYQVCDNQVPAQCATAKQVITIKPANAPNTTVAADDYVITQINTNATGNVKTNDSDPEGNTQTVTAQPGTIVPGKGTLVLAADGSYTFTPVAGFSGPVDFPYTTCDNGVPQACAGATLHILVRPEVPVTNPDFNSTLVNVPVPGNVHTNDVVPVGTTYGTSPTLVSSPLGSLPVLTMNSDGTYIFVTNMAGVYTYNVPVCVPGVVAPCPPTALVITVLDPNVNTNPPVANVDIATTKINTPVTLKSLANDAAGNPGSALVPSSVTVTVAPLHGTTSVNPANGDITFTPAAGYTGYDTLTYQVCDNQVPAKCATAKQIITIRPNNAPNTTAAADDYVITAVNVAATGNVKTNDTDPEGNAQTVTPQTTNIPGKGTLVLAADGSYTFTPVTGFAGPADFPYTTCDNGVPVACATATLHILVKPAVPVPDLSPNITVTPNIMHGTTQFNVTVRVTELLGNPTNGSEVMVRIPRDPRVSFVYNPLATQIGFTPVNNTVWTYDGTDLFYHIFRTSSVIGGNTFSTFGFVATFTPGQSRGKYTLTSSLNSGSGGEIYSQNNQDAEVLDYFID